MAKIDDLHQPTTDKPYDKELIPLMLVRAMFGMVFIILLLVSWAKFTDQPVTYKAPTGEITHERQIILSGDMAGSAKVTDLDGTVIADLTPEEGGFISGVYRVIHRERTKHSVALDGPLTLVRYDSGRIAIQDPSTGWSADLMGFGIDNAKAFARLLAQ